MRTGGVADDTNALQNVINLAAFLHKIDFGVYRVTRTILDPESFLSSGRFFANMNAPATSSPDGDKGSVEWSDMIVSTQGSHPH